MSSTKDIAIPDPQAVSTWTGRKLKTAIQKGHAVCGAHLAGYEEAAVTTGVLLREQKSRLEHGQWLPWLAENFGGSRQTAQEYMRKADEQHSQIASTSAISFPAMATSVAAIDTDTGETVSATVVADALVRPTHPEVYAPAVDEFQQGLSLLLTAGTRMRQLSQDFTALNHEAQVVLRLQVESALETLCSLKEALS